MRRTMNKADAVKALQNGKALEYHHDGYDSYTVWQIGCQTVRSDTAQKLIAQMNLKMVHSHTIGFCDTAHYAIA